MGRWSNGYKTNAANNNNNNLCSIIARVTDRWNCWGATTICIVNTGIFDGWYEYGGALLFAACLHRRAEN